LEIWDIIDVIIFKKNSFFFYNGFLENTIFGIFYFVIRILSYIEIIIIFISSIIILSRKSVIVDDRIITRYGVFKINEINSIALENKNTIRYELKKKSWHSALSFNNFKIKGNNGREISDFLNEKLIKEVI